MDSGDYRYDDYYDDGDGDDYEYEYEQEQPQPQSQGYVVPMQHSIPVQRIRKNKKRRYCDDYEYEVQ